MTVKEMVEQLSVYPDDAHVFVQVGSDVCLTPMVTTLVWSDYIDAVIEPAPIRP